MARKPSTVYLFHHPNGEHTENVPIPCYAIAIQEGETVEDATTRGAAIIPQGQPFYAVTDTKADRYVPTVTLEKDND